MRLGRAAQALATYHGHDRLVLTETAPDQRARMMERLKTMSADEQKQFVERMKSRGQDTKEFEAVIAASAAITATPISYGSSHIAALREAGLDDAEIVDVINAAAFFNWANRLMLSLGEPAGP